MEAEAGILRLWDPVPLVLQPEKAEKAVSTARLASVIPLYG